MPKSQTNPKVDAYLKKAKKWQEEMEALRAIILACPLTEELKWGKPCYTFQESNVVIVQAFRETCALMFCKGALLKDPHGLLKKPGVHTQAGRYIKLTSAREITERKAILKAYLLEAIAVQKAGLEVAYKKPSDFKIPAEIQKKLDETPALKKAFAALTPGRQRGYVIYFTAAKQAATREARVEKYAKHILQGKGIHDR